MWSDKKAGSSPARIMRPRVIAHVRDASNADILHLVTVALRDPKVRVEWPSEFDRDDAPLLVWETLRSFSYVADEDAQIVKAPRVLLNDEVGDCKSFTVFACHLLRAAGWNVWARFVKNDPGDVYGHVYCIAERNGRTVVVDGVMDEFDVEPWNFGGIDVPLR